MTATRKSRLSTKFRSRTIKKADSKRKQELLTKPGTPEQGHKRTRKKFDIEDERFEIGDDVYIALSDDVLSPGALGEEGNIVHLCRACEKRGTKKSVLIECTKCMHGYHLHCSDPPLSEIPEVCIYYALRCVMLRLRMVEIMQGLWICQDCQSGNVDKVRPLDSARELVLQQKGLGLGRIESISYDPKKEETFFECRWFCLPEETHIGRQSHHTAREVFLSSHRNEVSAESVFGRARVISLSEFSNDGDVDEDMFICDYEYDYQWKRFYRLSEWDNYHSHIEDSDDDDEARDETFRISKELAFGPSTLTQRGRKRKHQGGRSGKFLQLGTHDIQSESRFTKENEVSKASRALSLATVPDSMPCREEERADIEDFVRKVLSTSSSKNKAGKCLYICGIPGTGKTASVLEVVREISQESKQSSSNKFHFVEINGLQLPSPMHVYSQLYEALTGETLGPASAAIALEELFSGRSKKSHANHHHVIVLLDEMDSIVNKSQKALYSLFDWPNKSSSNLSIIGIANTMDLPERLHQRIGSRLAGSKVVFHPYTRDDLVVIMKTRLQECPIFDENAVVLAARKVANCSGDVRRCLELCRRSIEIALSNARGESNKLTVGVRCMSMNPSRLCACSTLSCVSCRFEMLMLQSKNLSTPQTSKCWKDAQRINSCSWPQ